MPSAAAATAKIQKEIYDSPQELELVHRAKEGDESAFTSLYNLHHNRIVVSINRIVQDEDAAHDLANLALTKVWIHLKDFDEKSKFSTWITRIAINEALMHERKKKRKIKNETSLESMQELHPNTLQTALTSRDLTLEGVVDRQMLDMAIERVPAGYREVLKLRYWDGDSVDEIRKGMRVRRKAVSRIKSRLMRGNRMLRTQIEKMSSVR